MGRLAASRARREPTLSDSAPELVGPSTLAPRQQRQSCTAAGDGKSIGGSRHTLLQLWTDVDELGVQGTFLHTRKHGRQVAIAFVNVLPMHGDQIAGSLIHKDSGPQFALTAVDMNTTGVAAAKTSRP